MPMLNKRAARRAEWEKKKRKEYENKDVEKPELHAFGHFINSAYDSGSDEDE